MKIFMTIITIVTALMGLAAVAPRSEKKEKSAAPESIDAALMALAERVFGDNPDYHDKTGVGRSRIAANCLDEWRRTRAEVGELNDQLGMAHEVYNSPTARLKAMSQKLFKAEEANDKAFEKLWLALYLRPRGFAVLDGRQTQVRRPGPTGTAARGGRGRHVLPAVTHQPTP